MKAHEVCEAIEPKDPTASFEKKTDKRALPIIYEEISDDILLAIAEKRTSKAGSDAIKTLYLGADNVKNENARTSKLNLSH